MATDMFLRIGNLTEEDVDIRNLKRDMDDLIADQHYGAQGRKSDRYAILALKHDISLPAEFSTLERAVLLIEGVCLKLDLNYSIMNEAKSLISEAMKERYSPGKIVEGIQFEADEYLNTLKNIPIGIDDVIKTIRGYRIEKLQGKGDVIKKNIACLMKCQKKSVFSCSNYCFRIPDNQGRRKHFFTGYFWVCRWASGWDIFSYSFLINY